MPQYLLSVHNGRGMDDQFGVYSSAEEMDAAMAATDEFNQGLQRDGKLVFAGGLQPADTATVVDGSGSAPSLTDGPYLETAEHIGGFWIIEAADLDEALALAAAGSTACKGKVEVRAFEG